MPAETVAEWTLLLHIRGGVLGEIELDEAVDVAQQVGIGCAAAATVWAAVLDAIVATDGKSRSDVIDELRLRLTSFGVTGGIRSSSTVFRAVRSFSASLLC